MSGRRTYRFFAAPLALLVSALASCSDTTEPPDTLEIVRLTVGTQTVHFDQSGLRSCCDGAGGATLNTRITIASGGTVTSRTHLTVATFHRADGKNLELDPAVHEVRLAPEASRVTFTRLSAFSGNLFRASAGVTGVTLTVVHTVTGEILFGPHQFSICTTPAPAPSTGCAS